MVLLSLEMKPTCSWYIGDGDREKAINCSL